MEDVWEELKKIIESLEYAPNLEEHAADENELLPSPVAGPSSGGYGEQNYFTLEQVNEACEAALKQQQQEKSGDFVAELLENEIDKKLSENENTAEMPSESGEGDGQLGAQCFADEKTVGDARNDAAPKND